MDNFTDEIKHSEQYYYRDTQCWLPDQSFGLLEEVFEEKKMKKNIQKTQNQNVDEETFSCSRSVQTIFFQNERSNLIQVQENINNQIQILRLLINSMLHEQENLFICTNINDSKRDELGDQLLCKFCYQRYPNQGSYINHIKKIFNMKKLLYSQKRNCQRNV
ncbi:hypothetical protein ABPG74_018026 [Tetrahymena malaccensis]